MFIGIDVGGTKTSLASTRDLSNVQIINQIKFLNKNDFDQDIKTLTDSIKQLQGTEIIKSIGIGLPGTINDEKNGILDAGNLSGWNGHNVKEILEIEFKCKVMVDNDLSLAALGEYYYGSYAIKDFIFLIWGTGIGGASIKVSNEKVLTEYFEVGYNMVSDMENFEFLEKICGGNGIRKRFGKSAEELNEVEWNIVTDYMARGIVNIVTISNAKVIIIGGGIGLKQPGKIEDIKTKAAKILKSEILPVPEIKLTSLNEDAGVYGAFALLK
jgi:glucokinase